MRAFEAISTELNRAKDINDAEALHGYANELDGLNSLQAQALACDARGWALYLTRDYMEALEQYHQALLLYEELGDRKGVASANGNLGTIYCGIAEYQKALEYQHRSLALYEELGDLKGMAANLGTLAFHIAIQATTLKHWSTTTVHWPCIKNVAIVLEKLPSRATLGTSTASPATTPRHWSVFTVPWR